MKPGHVLAALAALVLTGNAPPRAPWSAGWTGGTYRLRLVNGGWIFEVISSWIT